MLNIRLIEISFITRKVGCVKSKLKCQCLFQTKMMDLRDEENFWMVNDILVHVHCITVNAFLHQTTRSVLLKSLCKMIWKMFTKHVPRIKSFYKTMPSYINPHQIEINIPKGSKFITWYCGELGENSNNHHFINTMYM